MKKIKLSIYCLFCFMLLFFLITSMGCSGTTAMSGMTTSATSGTSGTSASGTDVTIQSNSFNPGTLTIKVGETVTWTNKDSYAHTVTSNNGSFDSGNMASGETFSFTFNTVGTYSYYCSIHTFMTAEIVVTQ
jgi:plastocyanin